MKGYYEAFRDESLSSTIERYNIGEKHVVVVHQEFPVVTEKEVKWVHENWCEEFKTYEAANAFFLQMMEARPGLKKFEC